METSVLVPPRDTFLDHCFKALLDDVQESQTATLRDHSHVYQFRMKTNKRVISAINDSLELCLNFCTEILVEPDSWPEPDSVSQSGGSGRPGVINTVISTQNLAQGDHWSHLTPCLNLQNSHPATWISSFFQSRCYWIIRSWVVRWPKKKLIYGVPMYLDPRSAGI